MRTLQFGLRVTDREESVAFYTALGYEVLGEVPDTPIGHLTMLKLPDDEFVALELVHDPSTPPTPDATTFSHFAVRVESVGRDRGAPRGRGHPHRAEWRRQGQVYAPPTSPIPTVGPSSSSNGRPVTPRA